MISDYLPYDEILTLNIGHVVFNAHRSVVDTTYKSEVDINFPICTDRGIINPGFKRYDCVQMCTIIDGHCTRILYTDGDGQSYEINYKIDINYSAHYGFTAGKRHGCERIWYTNGTLLGENCWYNGKLYGTSKYWNRDGTINHITHHS